ncbi:MAG TPA: PLP-dependent aminotransferase family protein, partial [Sphingobacterium sp.]|nr:PLP-dependent aminotransferase family protein [Sphingobacterium sp.]
MEQQLLYKKIANIVENQIKNGSLVYGDRLPSVRSAQKLYNVSLNTAKSAYMELESRSLIESRPKSGYFVSRSGLRRMAIPSISTFKIDEKKQDPAALIDKVFHSLEDKEITRFSLGLPSASLLPIQKLNRCIIESVHELHDYGDQYGQVQGSPSLRKEIAKWSLVLEGKISDEDLIITSGAMNAIYSCLRAVTKPGDTIAVESPLYFGFIQAFQLLGLKTIEIPTHPITGIELDALKKVIHKIDVCCFVTNFSNPLGALMPEEHKKELVKLLAHHHIPLIEDDLYGNIYFGSSRPKPCKYFDEEGLVMWCGSFTKVLAPSFRLGWVEPGQYKDKILKQKLIQTISQPAIYQEAVSKFLQIGRYDHHLNSFRKKLYSNYVNFRNSIEA